jgi:fluoroacetyl-CoA thioesterase
MDFDLQPGLRSKVEMTVAFKDTACAVASGLAEVFATPAMIALMENAAYTAVQPYLPEGYSTVGAEISAQHMSATPVGLKVWAEATLTQVEGRKLSFFIEAFDEVEKIGEAAHTRFIVDSARFLAKAGAKGKEKA